MFSATNNSSQTSLRALEIFRWEEKSVRRTFPNIFFLIIQPKGMRVVFFGHLHHLLSLRKIKKYIKILVNSPTTETSNDRNGCGKLHHSLPTIILKSFSDHLNLSNQIDPEVHQTSLFFWGSFGSHFCAPKSYLHFVWCIVFVVMFVGGIAQIQVYNSFVHHYPGGFDDIVWVYLVKKLLRHVQILFSRSINPLIYPLYNELNFYKTQPGFQQASYTKL